MGETLYDRMSRKRKTPPRAEQLIEMDVLNEILGSVVVIKADNVAEYVHAAGGMHDFIWTDLPNVAPPFKRFWIEMAAPVSSPKGLYEEWGVLFLAKERKEVEDLHFGGGVLISSLSSSVHWILDAYICVREGSDVVFPIAAVRMAVNEDGTVNSAVSDTGVATEDPNPSIMVGYSSFVGEPEADYAPIWEEIMLDYLFPALLSISFMHVRNVELVPRGMNEKLRKRYEKKHKRKPVKYHVITISPVKKMMAGAKSDTKNSKDFKAALHIVRGHFRDYRHGPGLFGKWKGVAWVESHVRGSSERGVSTKDYEVKGPNSADYPPPKGSSEEHQLSL